MTNRRGVARSVGLAVFGMLLPVLISFMAASSGTALAADPIRIGLQAPITGAWAYEGEMAVNSVQIVADQINARGGILGRPVELVVEDDQGSPRQGALAAQRLLTQSVVAVISTYGSSVTEPVATIYERAGMLNVAYGATAVSLTQKGYEYFFRTCFRDDRQGDFFAELSKQMSAQTVAILHDNTTFAAGLAEAARSALRADGDVDIVFYDAVTPGAQDFTATLSRVKRADPDVLYYTGYYPEAGLIARQASELGIEAQFVGGNSAINDEFIAIAGLRVAEGAITTQEPLPTDLPYDTAEVFLGEYVARHDAPPSTPWPVYAADALNVIASAIEQTGSTDSTVLADYLRDGLEINGITGPISFDDVGDRQGAIYKAYEVDEDGQLIPADV